jgi:hypothetical protein
MQLSNAQITEILVLLNQPKNIDAFASIAEAKPVERTAWVEAEDDEMYTEGSPLRRAHLEWLSTLLSDARKSGDQTTLVHYIEPTDFYFYTGELAAERRYWMHWLSEQELPLAAFLIWQTVFTFSFSRRRWTARPFLGVTPRYAPHHPERPDDPLLALPYSRKYDRERAGAALVRQTWLWERLCRARDVVKLMQARVERVEIPRHWDARWSWPKLEDIQEQLEEDGLCFELDSLMLFGGILEFEILRLETRYDVDADPPKPPTKHAVGPAYARGSYSGPLTQGFPSAASYKKMLESALDKLDANLWNVVYPYSDEEREQLQDEIDAVRASLTEPGEQGLVE